MTVQFATSGNLYLVGIAEIHVADLFNADTQTAEIDIYAYMQSEASGYPISDSSTAALLYKVSPILSIGTVYDNTQIYQGIPNTFQIGSYNYSSRNAYYSREFINFEQQVLKECSGIYPQEGTIPGTTETLFCYGVPSPSPYSPVDKLFLYLPNAEIDSVGLDLHYCIQQFSTRSTDYGYIWNTLSETYGA